MTDDIMELTPEEEALWRASDEEIENEAYNANSTFDEEPEEDLEQPSTETEEEPTDEVDNSDTEEDTDSDDEPETEDEETEDEIQDSTEEEEEVEKSDDEDTDEEAEEESKTESEQLRPVRANGVDIPVKSLDEVYQMASMGANYKQKMADIAPFRRSISAMKENGVSEADINTFIDMKKGSKEALQNFIKELGVDPLDIDVDSKAEYTPNQYGVDESTEELSNIVAQISSDPEYEMTQRVVDTDWDSESRKVLAENPAMIKGLHEEIKKGVYAKVAPEALRMEILDNGKKSKLEYYLAAEKLYYEAQANKESKATEVKTEQRQKTIQKKRAAAPTRSKATSSKTTEPDFINMSDEEYEKFYNEVMRS